VKITPVTPNDLAASVLAVPPMARNADWSLNIGENKKMIRHLEDGGVTTLMYGGNANFYNIGVRDYHKVLEMLEKLAAENTWVIPSIGPDFGKAIDQIDLLRSRAFPTAMLLPLQFPSTDQGLATGIARLSQFYKKPLIVYIKSDGYLEPKTVGKLVADGVVCAVKYGTVRADPATDAYLTELIAHVDPKLILSGIGETPAIVHLRDFGLAGFTSGSVCIAPRSSMKLLALIKASAYNEAATIREAFADMEACRDSLSPIRTLHEAVTLAGIADMGPMLPMLSNIAVEHHERIAAAAQALLAFDRTLTPS
jgi:dihydrodipicolinate synthase/N-acetylneuraminate lyase